MILPTPAMPFSRIKAFGDITIDFSETKNTLALQTDHPEVLPQYNEYTLQAGHTLPTAGTYALTNDYDLSAGLKNLHNNWIAVYDSASSIVDFFLPTYVLTKLQFTVNSSGSITQLGLNSENGVIYHGQLIYPDLTRDSNSDGIPDVLDFNYPGSLPSFLMSIRTINKQTIDGGSAMSTPSYTVNGGTSTSGVSPIIINGGI